MMRSIMNVQTLVASKKYRGKYVALKSFRDKKVIASGKEPNAVMERASKKGMFASVIVFIPKDDAAHVY